MEARAIVRDIPKDLWAILAGIRFLLATWVLFAHTHNFGTAARAMPVPSENALVAVYCFLAISGFSIHHSIAVHPRNYTARRIARVAPPHLASITIALMAYAVGGRVLYDGMGNPWPLPGLGDWIGCVLLLQALAPVAISALFPAWSLSIEVICYALAPYLRRKKSIVALALIVVSIIACFVRPKLSNLYIGSDSYGLSFLSMLWAWLAGWLAYSERENLLVYAVCTGMGIFAIAIDPGLSGWFNYIAWIFVVTMLWYGRARMGDRAKRLANYLGEISYPIYIIQYPVLFLLYNSVLRSNPELNWGIVQVAVVFLASAAVFRFVDQPYRARIAASLSRTAPPGVAETA